MRFGVIGVLEQNRRQPDRMASRTRTVPDTSCRVSHVTLIVLVQVHAVPAGRERQVELDTAGAGIIEVEVVGRDRVAEVGLAVALVNVRAARALAVWVAGEHLEALGPCLDWL